MEIESENGSKITLPKGRKREIGRGLGSDSDDRTISRKQISLSLQQNPRIQFEVIGKNPIWVYNRASNEIRVFKNSEKGEMVDGDGFCLSGRKPIWFSVREKRDERESGFVVDLDLELESVDISALDPVKEVESVDDWPLDPVKEFGFLVIGHDFDHYPKHKIRPSKKWDWFLEEPKKERDDDDDDDEVDGRKRNKSTKRKRKKGEGNDDEDEEWTGESEEDKELISKSRKLQRPKYSSRSKERDKPVKDIKRNKNSTQKKIIGGDEEEEEEEDEEDDTLGGFIVKDDEVKEEEEDDETELDDEEEEDFEEDDDED